MEFVDLFHGDRHVSTGRFYQADKGFSQGGIVYLDLPTVTSELELVDRLVSGRVSYSVRYEERTGESIVAFAIVGSDSAEDDR